MSNDQEIVQELKKANGYLRRIADAVEELPSDIPGDEAIQVLRDIADNTERWLKRRPVS